MSEPVIFFIPGECKTAGSKNAFAVRKKDANKNWYYTGRTIVTDSSGKKGVEWRRLVKAVAKGKFPRKIDGPVMLSITFWMHRPKSHYRTGKFSRELKESAPIFHLQKPDTTKLLRALEDALTGIAWSDDSQVCDQGAVRKRWACRHTQKAGASVRVQPLEEIPA